MELRALYKRVIGLGVHQAQITACALIEEPNGSVRIEQRQTLAQWAVLLKHDEGAWRARAFTARARMRRSKQWGFGPRWSTRGARY